MVVAGVFLLIRFSPLVEQSQVALSVCLCLGAVTSLFAAICALTQNDMKKIVAFSTSSQLGLMMVSVGLNQPQLAFFHICTHAFFKAMLFLCSGSLIHVLGDEQDIRKIGGLYRVAPVTCCCIVVGSLALTGVPFLAGFFSKDAIIEALNTSHLNAWALVLTLVATSFTAVYSGRMIYLVCAGHPRFLPLLAINERARAMVKPMKRLARGSILAGLFITFNVLAFKTPVLTMPPLLKMAGLAVSGVGLLMGLEVASLTSKQVKVTPNLGWYSFSNMLGFFPSVVHRLVPSLGLSFGQTVATQTVDLVWLEKLMPKAVSTSQI